MKLTTNDGIQCDLCATVVRSDFTYYSWDFKQFHANTRIPIDYNYLRSLNTTKSIDVCQKCMRDYERIIIDNNAKAPPGRTARKQGYYILCDLSGKSMAGDFDCLYCNITEVQVLMSGQPNVCLQCSNVSFEQIECPKCKSVRFEKKAIVNTKDRCLELFSSMDAFNKLVTK